MRQTKKPAKGRTYASERPEHLRARAISILKKLRKEFSRPQTALLHESPFQLLVATILSAQCTDERVNLVTKDLLKKYRSPSDLVRDSQAELEQEIRSTGFYRMKAKNIIACSEGLVKRHGGKVPDRLEDLVELAGVGRKTANVVLGQAFGIPSGVVVDTHVHRIARRLGLTQADSPEKIEEDLMAVFPKRDWIEVGSVLILHGRKTCVARKPACDRCPVRELCPSAGDFPPRVR